MLMLSTLHDLLSQVLSPPSQHTVVLFSTTGELISFHAEPSRPKDEIRLLVGLCGEVWQETKEQGCGMVDSELGRIIVLPVDDFSGRPDHGFSEEHQPLLLLAINAVNTVDWDELQIKGKTLATHLATPLSKFREIMKVTKRTPSTTTATSPAPPRART